MTGRRSRTVSGVECKRKFCSQNSGSGDVEHKWLNFSFHFNVPVKHSGSVTFDEIVGIARVMRPRSIARELSGEELVG